MMAIFGSPVPYKDHARRALKAALDIVENAKDFSYWMAQRFDTSDLPDFDIGVGVHTGEAVMANIGSQKRMEFTAIGDTVNIASRLEGITKEIGWKVIASADTIKAAGSDNEMSDHRKVCLKGHDGQIEIFHIIKL